MSDEQNYLVPLQSIRPDIELLVSPVSKIVVKDFPTSQTAIEAGKQVKELHKRIESMRKALVDPLNKSVKAINEYAKSIGEPLLKAETHIKAQLCAFDAEQEKIRAEARRIAEAERLQKERELREKIEAERLALQQSLENEQNVASIFGADPRAAEKKEAAIAALEQKHVEAIAIQKSEAQLQEYDIAQQGIKNMRKTWKCEAIDLSIVPKEFLTIQLNEKAVLAMARAGITSIPGVRLWQESSVAFGANTYVPQAALKSGR